MKRFITIAVAALAVALPGSALAATSSNDVAGTVGSELSVSATAPGAMSFSPSTDGLSSSTVTVSSTQSAWTLSISDAGATTPGQLDKVDCTTRVASSGSLASALGWAGPALSGSLSDTAATVKSGASVEDVAVSFTQAIGATEDLVADDCYQLAVTWTVT
jgi:hypothetical protein